ncbi:MAG: stage 0 sporulation family protein [Candidatus Limimorpha sp.]
MKEKDNISEKDNMKVTNPDENNKKNNKDANNPTRNKHQKTNKQYHHRHPKANNQDKEKNQVSDNQENTVIEATEKVEIIEIQTSEIRENIVTEKREDKERKKPENNENKEYRKSDKRDYHERRKIEKRDNTEHRKSERHDSPELKNGVVQKAESQEKTVSKQQEVQYGIEQRTIDNQDIIGIKRTEMPEEEEELKITWPLHDSMEKQITKDFHRGCRINPATYEVGCNVLRHGQCKLDSFNWLKDYENETKTFKEGELSIVEVRFKNDRKDFFSYPSELRLSEGELVVVETTIGHDVGIVSLTGELVDRQRKRKKRETPITELKKVLRRAKINDVEKFLEAIQQEERTLHKSREIASSLNLEMKLNDIEYQGDRTKAIFYYTADGRVDFRELIKKLAEEFHVRVEMRQIGFRQESAKLGGIGSCGRELCCSSWVTDFQSVTTSVARVQQLSPNPQKLAGQCGKLKCCLNYEYETYIDALKEFPDNRIVLKTKKGDGVYQKIDIFKGLMWYSYPFDKNNMMAIPAEKVKEIIEDNKKGVLPEQLEDFAFIKEQKNNDYGEDGQNVDLSKLE